MVILSYRGATVEGEEAEDEYEGAEGGEGEGVAGHTHLLLL